MILYDISIFIERLIKLNEKYVDTKTILKAKENYT